MRSRDTSTSTPLRWPTHIRTGLPCGFFEKELGQRRDAVRKMAFHTPGESKPVTWGKIASFSAVRPLLEAGDPTFIRPLTTVAELDPDVRNRRNAVAGLQRMNDPAAVPGLLAGLRSSDRATRVWAIRGLQRLRARAAVPELTAVLADWRQRYAAATALVAIRDERALQPLREASRHGLPWSRVYMHRRVRELEQRLGY
jgi:HEAT repeat protein